MSSRRRQLALSALVVAMLAPGCVGITYVGTETYDDAEASDHVPQHPRRRPGTQSEEDLLHAHGEPDEREAVSATEEIWTYDDGLRWNGPVLFVVIPLPLVIPVGRESTTYHLEDGVVQRVVRVEQTWEGTICGLIGHFAGCNSMQK